LVVEEIFLSKYSPKINLVAFASQKTFGCCDHFKIFGFPLLMRNTSKNQKYGKMTPTMSQWLDFFSG
jgi:hypothetical protein